MNAIARRASNFLRRLPSQGVSLVSQGEHQIQQWRGIRVKVRNGNLEQALRYMQFNMQSSGMERLIKSRQTHHLKNSEKRILARKRLEHRIRSQGISRKLQIILCNKVRQVIKKSMIIGLSVAHTRSKQGIHTRNHLHSVHWQMCARCGALPGPVREALKYLYS
ncbi:unnamed protein product [Dovyalis caffra]|uniref:Ribosomal protein S21 n=1 Tax=Dovyalis caffra TaxID=77055 RepID=A0AAV1RDH0_9ROSI|nr:unnamed protein product [Dovyalis caffra]